MYLTKTLSKLRQLYIHTRQGLAKTPERAAKALMFFTKGYNDNMKGIYYGEKGGSSSSNFYKNNIKAMYKTKQHLKEIPFILSLYPFVKNINALAALSGVLANP
jgi:hypothetical protein